MKNNVVKGSLCCAGCVINVGFSYLMTNLAGLLCVPLMTKLGCAYTDIAMIWTTLSLGAVIARAFQGQLYDKFNPKIVTLLGAFSLFLLLLPKWSILQALRRLQSPAV